jgi:large subunit ribosomal protein L41
MNFLRQHQRQFGQRLVGGNNAGVVATTAAALLQLMMGATTTTTTQVRSMSKFISKSAKKRLTLTTKRAGKGFYKGKGGTKEGKLNSKGKFIADPLRKLELIVPDLTNFRLKPYIANTASKFPPEKRYSPVS